MKFSLSWLKAHLETDATIDQIAVRLNQIGLEVEGIENPADKLSAFKIARVISAAPHPQADKLQVLMVDNGGGKPLQVVCGAPNARAGMLGVFGPAGATVPSNGMVLKVAAIRGVESNGMMCSVAELALGDDHDGILELPEGAPVGGIYADWAGLDDAIIDVSVTPNRQDCMGVRGIARDLAAAGLGTLKPQTAQTAQIAKAAPATFPCPTEIRTDDTAGCPAFYGRVIKGVSNGASPEWMQARLKSAGQKPISALVDITNYVMLDHGRPSHAYDLSKLSGAVFARRAMDGEIVTALNGKDYTLTSQMTVIADDAGVHDIAGIMGGAHSGCSAATTDVLLEVAYFTPEAIARTGQALLLTSDARTRFERGVDPAFLGEAVEIITALIIDICGGQASEIARAGIPPADVRTLDYDPSYCARLGGVDVSASEQRATLERLGFGVDPNWQPSVWQIAIPSWRRDIEGAADIVEEIIRIYGLDNVPSTPLPRDANDGGGVARPTATPMQKLERKLRRSAAARGLNEAINWSFLPEKEAAAFGGSDWILSNPISEDMKAMRPSLLPGLLSAARRNIDRGASSVRLFELGRRYFKAADGSSYERQTLAIVLAGEKSPRGWAHGKAVKFDVYDAKAEVLALSAAAGVATSNLMIMDHMDSGQGGHYHPGQSATLRMGPKNVLAAFGTLHPATAKAFDLDSAPLTGAIVAAEIYLDAIPVKKSSKDGGGFMRSVYTPPALQAVTRDFAFLVPADLPAGDLVRLVKGCDKANITAVRLFDRFGGQGVPSGQVSLAIEVTMQPAHKSYTDAELQEISDKVIAAAAKLGGVLRR